MRRRSSRNTRIVEQQRHRAERALDFIRSPRVRCPVSHIELDRLDRGERREFRLGVRERRHIQIGQGEFGAGATEGASDPKSDSVRSARDEGGPSLHIGHAIPLRVFRQV